MIPLKTKIAIRFIPIFVCFLLTHSNAFSQGQNNIWYFGHKAGLDFNSTPPLPVTGALISPEGTASISTSDGELLFYTDGRTVFDRNHQPMPNGTGLDGGESSTQAVLILPLPHSSNLYYIFTTQQNAQPGRLSYSVVNSQSNGGLGDVEPTQKNIVIESGTTEKLTCSKHQNGTDIWIIAHRLNSNQFISYLLSATGLSTTPVVSPVGSFYASDDQSGIGYMKASLSGSKLACAGTVPQILELFDFNTTTGEVYNYIDLAQMLGADYYVYGLEFSQSECFLYVTSSINRKAIIQIDLSAMNYEVLFENASVEYGALQLGPDGRIYVAKNLSKTIDVIERPDLLGGLSEYAEDYLELDSATTCQYGLPNLAPFFNITNILSYSLLEDHLNLCQGTETSISIHFPYQCDDEPDSVFWSTGDTTSTIQVSEGGLHWVEVYMKVYKLRDTIIVNALDCSSVVRYDLNDCESFMGNGSHIDYSEFVPSYPQPLSCAEIEAGTLHRDNPAVNKHSCTPGVDGSPGMCVGTLAGCTYIPGHEASVVIEVNITPDPDTAVYLTGFSFFEKAPTTFDWISGPSGPNNWPTWFRVRVLKNGTEIFLTPPTATSPVWKEATYDFFKNDEFLVTEPTTFRFELLSYCPIGNGATESVWDLDEINIIASCASPAGLNNIITGVVKTPGGAHVRGVEMRLYEDLTFTNPQTVETLYNGTYAFESVVPGSDYYIQGYKNDDPLNGVSTLDLIRIQKHLLGKQLFTSPYQYIAADANRSNTITAIDLIEFRKLLLGIYSTLPRNKSWRFGLASQVLEQGAPWNFNETYPIEYLSEDIWDADFIGVKIGDVTGDVKANAGGTQITNRSVGETTLKVRDQYIPAGAVHQVDILAEDFRDVAGLQMQLAYAGGQILDVVGGAMKVSTDQYRIKPDGQVLISWNEEELLSVEAGQVLFSLIVLPGRAGQTADLLSIAQQGLAAEMYFGDDLEQHTIVLKGSIGQDDWSGEVMLQGDPNPFTQVTTLKYNLQADSEVTLRFYDPSGRLLFSTESIGNKGLNTLEVTRDQLGLNEGMVICQLQAGDFVAVEKLMLLRG